MISIMPRYGPRTSRHRRLAVAAVLCLALPVAAQTATRPSAVVAAEQCAADAAFQKLVDTVLALRLADETTVAELWASLPAAEQALRQRLLVQRALGKAHRAADGAVEVDASIQVSAVNKILQDLAAKSLPDRQSASLAVRPGDRALVAATGRWQGPPPARPGPAGWRHCDAGQLDQVAAAARIDARQHLMATIGKWRLSAAQTLENVWAQRPDFRQAVEKRTEVLPLGEPAFEPAGLCRLASRFQRADVVKLLTSAAEACSEPINSDLASAIDPDGKESLALEGLAVAPPYAPQRKPAEEKDHAGRPDWADRVLTVQVTGQAPAHLTEAAERSRMATLAATVEAKRQLWLQIEKLPLPSGATVGDVLAAGKAPPAIAAISDAFTLEAAPSPDNPSQATVTLGIPLEAVWQALADLNTPKK